MQPQNKTSAAPLEETAPPPAPKPLPGHDTLSKVGMAALVVVRILQVASCAMFIAFLVFSPKNLLRQSAEYLFEYFLSLFVWGFLVLLSALMGSFVQHLRKDRSPFGPIVIRRIRQIALAFAVLAVAQLLIDWLAPAQVGLFFPMWMYNVEFFAYAGRTLLSLPFLLAAGIALLLYCVALAFTYGARLQQQDDETL